MQICLQNNNNVNINDQNINFMMMGAQNMGRGFRRNIRTESCVSYFLCEIKERRDKLHQFEHLGLKSKIKKVIKSK